MTGRKYHSTTKACYEELTATSKLGAMLHGRLVCSYILREEDHLVVHIAYHAI